MRIGARLGILIIVSRNQTLNIRCDIDSVEGAIRGELDDGQGVSRSFNGWTEFATALMALVRDTQDKSPKANIEEKTS